MRTIPSEVRARVLSDHAVLRGTIDEVRRLLGEGDSGALRELFTELLHALVAHLEVEDRILIPTLRVIEPSLAELFSGEHDAQRAWVRRTIARLADPAAASKRLLRDLTDFIDDLERDMNVEEAAVIDERELPDDPFGFELPS